MQPRNIVVLTHGWTGSSVFAALLGRAGYWLGDSTVRKTDYDTHENSALVERNRELLARLAPGLSHEHRFSDRDVSEIAERAGRIDLAPLREFIESCDSHGTWLWKDPRLTWTIRVWARVMDLQRTAFLLLTREDLQAWISANARRHVQTWRFTRSYNHGITASNRRFVDGVGGHALQLSFEDLLLRPEDTLSRLNEAYRTSMAMADLHAVCREPLYRRSRDVRSLVEAGLVFLKNYDQRDGRARRDGPYTSRAASSL